MCVSAGGVHTMCWNVIRQLHVGCMLMCVQAIEEFTGGVSSKELQLVKVEGGYHEMLMGDERIGSADGIMAWMRQRLDKPWQQLQDDDAQQQQQQEGAGSAASEHVSKL
jgi:hypothetical protein